MGVWSKSPLVKTLYSCIPEVLDGDSSLCVFEDVQQYPGPVAAIAQFTEI